MKQPLPLKNVTVQGELRTRILKNFSRMHDRIYRAGTAGIPPFCCIGWPGDWEGRAMLALTLDKEVLNTEAPTLEPLINWIYQLMNDEGYRSEPDDKLNLADINEQMHSAQNWMLRAFMETYRITGEEKYLDTAKQIIEALYLPVTDHLKNYPRTKEDRVSASDYAVIGHTSGTFREWRLSSDIGCIFMSFDPMWQAWGLIDEEPLKTRIGEYIRALLDAFRSVDYVGSGLQTHATLTCMRGLMRVYRITKDKGLLATIEKYFDDYEKNGMTVNYENRNGFRIPGHTEPCGIVDSYMLACQLWEVTGKRHYLDMSHKIWWNGLMRSQRDNGGMGCDTTVDDGRVKVYEAFYEAFHCCTMRGAEGLGYPARHAVYEEENTFMIPFFFDFDAALTSGDKIKVRTLYPEEGKLSLTVTEGTGKTANVKLYIPEWAEDYTITKNGTPLSCTVTDECFASFVTPLETGDEITVTFTQPIRKVPCTAYGHADKGMYTIEYGTLVLGTEIGIEGRIDLSEFTYTGNGKFRAYDREFTPLHMCYFLTKEEVMAKSWQVLFG